MEWIERFLMTLVYALLFWLMLGLEQSTWGMAVVLGVFYQSFEEIKKMLNK